MFDIYVYVLDTLADWEIGYVTAELNSKRFFKKDAPSVTVKTVGNSDESVKTMGGLTILPDGSIDDIVIKKSSILILPGADTWSDSKNIRIIQKAKELIAAGGTVCAICGATVVLANAGLLDQCAHTSNGPGFLEMFAKDYKGKNFYIDEPSVMDQNLITASSTGSLQWTKQILERLDVFQENTMKAWYDYFTTGKAESFFALMQTLQ